MPIRPVPFEAIDLIQKFEGIADGDPATVNLDPYLDPVGIWTIGWGHAITCDGKFVRGRENKALACSQFPGGITREQALDLLRGELVLTGRDVEQMVTCAIEDCQYGALVSFAFNAGAGNLRQSTLLKKLNAGDVPGAADEFLKWTKATDASGRKIDLPGLVARRSAERALFLNAVSGSATGTAREMPPAKRQRRATAKKKASAKRRAPRQRQKHDSAHRKRKARAK